MTREERKQAARAAATLAWMGSAGAQSHNSGLEDETWTAACLVLGVEPSEYLHSQVSPEHKEDDDYMRRWNLATDIWETVREQEYRR